MNLNPETTILDLKQMLSIITLLEPPNLINFLYNNSIIFQDNWKLIDCFPDESQILLVPSHEGGSCISFMQFISEIPFKDLNFLKKSLGFLNNKPELQQFFETFDLNAISLKTTINTKNLKDDELAAIILWTTNIIYKDINKALIENSDLSKWKYFLKCFSSGIRKFSYHKGIAYRGVRNYQDPKLYKKGAFVNWQNINSLSKSKDEALKCLNNQGTLFELEIHSSRDISRISLKQEIILEPHSSFVVMKTEEIPEGPFHVFLKEISVPRAFKVIFWVDDNPQYNYKYAMELENQGVSVVMSTSTKEAISVISVFRWLLYFPNSAFKIVTDMVRNEDGLPNFNAGIDLIEELCMKFKYSFEILCFCIDVEKAKENCAKRNLKGNFRISNLENDLMKFLVF